MRISDWSSDVCSSDLDAMPGVQESAVIGVPHADFGEAVVAVVVPQRDRAVDVDGMLADLKTNLANFKVPKKIYIIDALPRNTMGKVQKNALRQQYKEDRKSTRLNSSH